MNTPRDIARENWSKVAKGEIDDLSLREWLSSVACKLLVADDIRSDENSGNTRHLSIVEATGLTGKRNELISDRLRLTFAIRHLQLMQERNPEEFSRTDSLTYIALHMGWMSDVDDDAMIYRWRVAYSLKGKPFNLPPADVARALSWMPKGFQEPYPPADPQERKRFLAAMPPLTDIESAALAEESRRELSDRESIRKKVNRHIAKLPADLQAEFRTLFKRPKGN